MVAYIDWDHFALHDVDVVVHGSSSHFDTLFEQNMLSVSKLFALSLDFHTSAYYLGVCHRMDSMPQSYHRMC